VLVYLVGGMVFWVRLRDAHLPTSFGLSLIDPRSFLVVGLTEMIAPVLITTVLTVGFIVVTAGFGPKTQEPAEPVRVSPRTLRIVRISIKAAYALLVGFALLVSPLGWSGLGQLLFFVNSWFVAGLVYHTGRGGRVVSPHLWRVVATLFVAVPLLTMLGELDGPSQLNRVDVTTTSTVIKDAYYVSTTADYVYLGENRRIVAIPISSVQRLEIRQPPPLKRPQSLLDKITG
jgi:hypothetical protein